MIPALPALDLFADALHYREAGLDPIGATQALPQQTGDPEAMNRERFFQSLR